MPFEQGHNLFLIRPAAVMLVLLGNVGFDLSQFGLAEASPSERPRLNSIRGAEPSGKLPPSEKDCAMNRHFQAAQRIFTPAVSVLVWAAMATGAARSADCDRACLQNMITRYVDAMVAHAPSRLPLAAKARFTEDSHELGGGLWKTVTRKGDFRQDYIDRKRQIAASHVVLFEGDTQVIYSVVLHVAKRKVSGIETLVYRVPADVKHKPDQLSKPLVGMGDPVPAGKGTPRAEMVRVALSYAEGLRLGSFVKSNTPFAPQAYRLENGVKYAGGGCVGTDCAIRTQKLLLHPDIKTSVAAVDEEAGTVLLWMNFGDTHSYGPNKALVTFEAFKIWDGAIHAVNAFLCYLPKETARGWPSAE
jgi:hypothetical protein